MEVKKVIEKLQQYNPDATMGVIVHNQIENFTITWGGIIDGEGTTKQQTTGVNFYVDRLNQGENLGTNR